MSIFEEYRAFSMYQLVKNYARILYLILKRNICFGYLLESPLTNIQNIRSVTK